jgi:hypothetical protein
MHATICELGFDAGRNAFMQSFGSGELDAKSAVDALRRVPPS